MDIRFGAETYNKSNHVYSQRHPIRLFLVHVLSSPHRSSYRCMSDSYIILHPVILSGLIYSLQTYMAATLLGVVSVDHIDKLNLCLSPRVIQGIVAALTDFVIQSNTLFTHTARFKHATSVASSL